VAMSQTVDVLTLEQLVVIGALFAFLSVPASVLALRRIQPDLHRPFRVPAAPFTAAVTILAVGWLMVNLKVQTWVYFGIWMALGLALYMVYGRRKSQMKLLLDEPPPERPVAARLAAPPPGGGPLSAQSPPGAGASGPYPPGVRPIGEFPPGVQPIGEYPGPYQPGRPDGRPAAPPPESPYPTGRYSAGRQASGQFAPPGSPADPHAPDPYTPAPYAPDSPPDPYAPPPYSRDPYASGGPYGTGASGSDQYGSDQYGTGASGSDQYGSGRYRADSYGGSDQDGDDPYGSEPHGPYEARPPHDGEHQEPPGGRHRRCGRLPDGAAQGRTAPSGSVPSTRRPAGKRHGHLRTPIDPGAPRHQDLGQRRGSPRRWTMRLPQRALSALAAFAVSAALLTVPPAAPAAAAGAGPGCDPIDPAACLLPFPNDWYTVADGGTPTGRRVHLRTTLKNRLGVPLRPAEWNRADGFSPGSMLLSRVPGVDLERSGAAPITDIGASRRDDAPIVIVDTATGERWPYWAELDANAPDDRKALIIRPAVNFREGHRYAVALRRLRDASGKPIAPGAAFARILGPTLPSGDPLHARQRDTRRVLADLERHGVGLDGLYLAWDFTVASSQSLAGPVLHMRDEALRKLGNR